MTHRFERCGCTQLDCTSVSRNYGEDLRLFVRISNLQNPDLERASSLDCREASTMRKTTMMRLYPMFPVHLIGNTALVVLGYEAATTRTLPHWAVLLSAIIVALGLAFQASRSLARAYDREDRTFSMFERLWRQQRQM